MSTGPSATQVFRQAQLGQLLDHETRIRELEEEVKALEAERDRLRTEGGTAELAALPGAALSALLAVFDAVPIPDLSAFERQQALARLGPVLEELQAKAPAQGGVAPGSWSWGGGSGSGKQPRVQVAEGDGASVARLAREIVRVLGDVAGRYLAQMVEFQGTTPEPVSKARASQLVDASALADTKEQFGLLPPDRQRTMFESTVDQLIVARDQLHAARTAASEARQVLAGLVEKLGQPAPKRDATVLTLARTLATQDTVGVAPALRDAVVSVVTRYAGLLPDATALGAAGLPGSTTTFRQGFAGALGSGLAGGLAGATTASDPRGRPSGTTLAAQADLAARAPAGREAPEAESEDGATLPLLAQALDAALSDHEALAEHLRDAALDARERAAMKRLGGAKLGAKAGAGEAREEIARVAPLARAVEAAAAGLEEGQRAVVKRFSKQLEACARERIAASERPDSAAAAFEHLSKAERVVHLARLWQELVLDLRRGLADPEVGLDALEAQARAALVEAHGRSEESGLEARRRDVEAVHQALQRPATWGEGARGGSPSDDLELGTPIDVEQGLLGRQAQELDERVAAFLARYSRAKKAGCQTLIETAAKLEEIEAAGGKKKRAALDAIAAAPQKGKLSAAKELATAHALLAEQAELAQGNAELDARKAAAFERERARLSRLGLSGVAGYDAAWARLDGERARLARAAEAIAARDARAAEVVAAARRLGAEREGVDAARDLLRLLEVDGRKLDQLAAAVEAAQEAYLVEANGLIKKRAPDAAGARVVLDEVQAELARVDALRASATTWVAGFAAFRPELRSADKIRDWVRKERKKAGALSAAIDEGASAVQAAVEAMGRGAGPPSARGRPGAV